LLSTGRAIPHPAFPNSRTTASYQIQSAEDVTGALELFRMNYERRKERNDPAKAGSSRVVGMRIVRATRFGMVR